MAADATELAPVRRMKVVALPPFRFRDVVVPPNDRHPASGTSRREIHCARLAGLFPDE